jgi:thymidine kinase
MLRLQCESKFSCYTLRMDFKAKLFLPLKAAVKFVTTVTDWFASCETRSRRILLPSGAIKMRSKNLDRDGAIETGVQRTVNFTYAT